MWHIQFCDSHVCHAENPPNKSNIHTRQVHGGSEITNCLSGHVENPTVSPVLLFNF